MTPCPVARLLLSVAVGLAYGMGLVHGLPQYSRQQAQLPATLRVWMPAPALPTPQAPQGARERLPVEAPTLASVGKSPVQPVRVPNRPKPAEALQPLVPLESNLVLPEFEPSVLPDATVQAPETPPDDAPVLTYRDAPGGDVLVLGLLVDHTGLVLETQVLIASQHAMEDLTFALAMRGQYFSRVEPPLSVGQTRWVQARIPYAPTTQSLLP